MTKTYTTYKLTDPMLQRLSALAHHREPHYGTPMQALLNRNLVYVNDQNRYQINGLGLNALQAARTAGW